MVGRSCSECGRSLDSRPVTTKTCSQNCRQKRYRRIARTNRELQDLEEQQGPGAEAIAKIVRNETPDAVRRLISEQLQPVVREAITEDVLRAISDMVGLAPSAVAALEDDLDSDDQVIRHRAAALVIKYTVGHPAIVRPDESPQERQMTVNFNLPRPGDTDLEANNPEATDTTLQECDSCHSHKPASEFVAGSTRCGECFATWKERVLETFA